MKLEILSFSEILLVDCARGRVTIGMALLAEAYPFVFD